MYVHSSIDTQIYSHTYTMNTMYTYTLLCVYVGIDIVPIYLGLFLFIFFYLSWSVSISVCPLLRDSVIGIKEYSSIILLYTELCLYKCILFISMRLYVCAICMPVSILKYNFWVTICVYVIFVNIHL